MKTPNLQDKNILKHIVNDSKVRQAVARESHPHFFSIYFGEYIKHKSASFHKEMFDITENEDYQFSAIVAFRGSAKSTIFSLSYPIWSILGKQQKKYVLIFSQTQKQARQMLDNIKAELESNDLLRQDLGPFEEVGGEWNAGTLVIPKYDARITVASTEQSIRGVKHRSHRPDLMIFDDIENTDSTKTSDAREKTFKWFNSEVLPAGDIDTKYVMIGNLVHEDCLIKRIQRQIQNDQLDGIYREYPFVDAEGNALWNTKFPDKESIRREKNKIMSPVIWHREYLLQIIPDEGQLIHREWIQYYDSYPTRNNQKYKMTGTAVDLAISQKDSADYTAIITARLVEHGEDSFRIYIEANPINKRLTFPQQIDTLVEHARMNLPTYQDKLWIEKVGYQEALIQALEEHDGIREVHPYEPKGDKRARLALTTTYISDGIVVFPKEGCEELITQLVGFGSEPHDDLADAFSMLVNCMVEEWRECNRFCGIIWI